MRQCLAYAVAVLLAVSACDGGQPAPPESSAPKIGPTQPTGQTPSATTAAPVSRVQGRSRPVADPLYPEHGNPAIDVLSYDLDLAWDPEQRRLNGTATLEVRLVDHPDEIRLDFADPLAHGRVTLDGRPVLARHPGDQLVVPFEAPADDRLRLVVKYSGTPEPAPAPTTREDLPTVGFHVEPDGSAWTLQEPYGAFTWYPVNDHPSDEAIYDVTVTVPTGWSGVSNGLLVGRREAAATTAYHWRSEHPMASYLVTLGIGPYRYHADEGPNGLPVNYWLLPDEPGYLRAVSRTPELITWLESKLGPYPFESIGVLAINSRSGIETQTLVTVGSGAPPGVLLHEYAHQWYGDSVTPLTWEDLWMNEGFAYFVDWVYAAEHGGPSLAASAASARRQDQQLRTTYGPPGDYDPTQFASFNVYSSGALMLYEIRRRVGAETFDRLLRQWPQEYADQSVDRETYVRWVEQKTGHDVSDLVDRWLTSPTTPR